jgi:alpha-glucosidase (family GH31 glycosyl hydrolase)
MKIFKYFFYFTFLISCNKKFDFTYKVNNDQKPLFIPFWIFGFHVWEDMKNDSKSVNYLVDNYTKNNINISSIIFDSPWATSYNDFNIDSNRYKDYSLLFKTLNYKSIKKIFWLTGFQNIISSDALNSKSSLYDFYYNRNYFVNNANIYSWWKGKGSHVDFYNPAASNNFLALLNNFNYADGWKLDEGYSYLPNMIKTLSFDSINNVDFGNKYYSEITHSQIFKKRVTLGRAYSSQGINPRLHSLPDNLTFAWCGDHRGDSQGIHEQLFDIYNSIKLKHNLLCWEVGGYNFPAPSKIDLINSLKIGIMLPMLSNGGRNGGLTNHLPWFYDTETIQIFKKYIDLHYNLMPLFFSETLVNGKDNLLKINNLSNNSYYISNDIVVFNNFYSDNKYICNFDTNYKWINILNDEIINGRVVKFNDSFGTLSSFIKNGSILPIYNFYKQKDTIFFKIFPYNNNKKYFHLPQSLEDTFCKVEINYSIINEEINIISNCNKNIKLLVKSKTNPNLFIDDKYIYDETNQYIIFNIDKTKNYTKLKINGLKNYN